MILSTDFRGQILGNLWVGGEKFGLAILEVEDPDLGRGQGCHPQRPKDNSFEDHAEITLRIIGYQNSGPFSAIRMTGFLRWRPPHHLSLHFEKLEIYDGEHPKKYDNWRSIPNDFKEFFDVDHPDTWIPEKPELTEDEACMFVPFCQSESTKLILRAKPFQRVWSQWPLFREMSWSRFKCFAKMHRGWLFRGQAGGAVGDATDEQSREDNQSELSTSLGRGKNFDLERYLRTVFFPVWKEMGTIPGLLEDLNLCPFFEPNPREMEKFYHWALQVLRQLRHHQFPTPILDWTEDPRVAVFYACMNARRSKTFPVIYLYDDKGLEEEFRWSDIDGTINLLHPANLIRCAYSKHFGSQSQRESAQSSVYMLSSLCEVEERIREMEFISASEKDPSNEILESRFLHRVHLDPCETEAILEELEREGIKESEDFPVSKKVTRADGQIEELKKKYFPDQS